MRCIFVAACCVMFVVLPVLAEDSGKEKKPAPTLQSLGLTLTSVNDMGHSAESLPARANMSLPAWKNVIQDAFVVNKVETGSKADEEGLEANDVISTINKQRFPSLDEANAHLGQMKSNKLELSVYKNNRKYKTVNITLRETQREGGEDTKNKSGNNTAASGKAKAGTAKKFRGDEIIDLENFLTERGFEVEKDEMGNMMTDNIRAENALAKLAQYGTAKLQDKLKKGADDFDRHTIKKQIEAELEKIKSRKFALYVVCGNFQVRVGDDISSCVSHIDLPFCEDRDANRLIGKERIGSLNFSYKRGSEWIDISVSGTTDEIRELVRSKKACFRIVFTNLRMYGSKVEADILDVKMVDMKKR